MIAVTGATGHLGRLVIDALLARGVAPEQIVAAVRTPARAADLAAAGVQVREADYALPQTLAAAFAGVETVMLVSSSEVGQRVVQHGNVITAAVAAGVARIVYTSAPHADTSPLVLAPDHKATEELLATSGLATTILRNGWYTENYVGAVEQARQTGVIAASVGDARVASASRQDYAEAAAVVLTSQGHDGAVYELTGDTSWEHSELAAAASEVLGRDVVYRPLTAQEHTAALLAAGLDEGLVGFLVALDANVGEGLLAETTDTLSTLLGRPTTPLVEGLAAALGVSLEAAGR